MIYYFSRKNLLLLGQSTQRASSITPVTRSHLSNSHNLLLVVQSLSRIQLCDPCELHHARLLCPPLSPRVCSKSCPLSQCCYLTISSSAALFSFCLQSFPASGSFQISWFLASGGQITFYSNLKPIFYKFILKKRTTGHPYAKKKKVNLDIDLRALIKINSKWILDLNVKHKTIKLLKITKERHLYDLE